MTDDDNTGWRAASHVYGEGLSHYLCKWHIHRAWRRQIQQHFRNHDDHQLESYAYLCAKLEAKSRTAFEEYKQRFLSRFTIYPDFCNYITTYYLDRKEKWALCFRQGDCININTNMYVESFHNQLKTIYLEGKRNRRVDDLLDTLLKMEKNYFLTHFKRSKFQVSSNENIKSQDRHRSSLNIPLNHIALVNQNTFTVISTTGNTIYDIKLKNEECEKEDCNQRNSAFSISFLPKL